MFVNPLPFANLKEVLSGLWSEFFEKLYNNFLNVTVAHLNVEEDVVSRRIVIN
jgi:hypothetical protein